VNQMKLQFEVMRREHLPDILWIEQACMQDPWPKTVFMDELDQTLAHYYVACMGDVLVAYGGFWMITDEAHITNIAVHPDYRNQGIAVLLMAEMEREAVKLGAGAMTLEVRTGNEPAKGLYRKMGFSEAGVRKDYYQDDGEDAVIMWKHGK